MNRINKKFKDLQIKNKKAFISYITAGDPNIDLTEDIILSLIKSGVDIIEIGIPFSDPLADGPTIQKAIERSLKNGCSVKKVFSLTKNLRKKTKDIPFIFMTYYNIIFSYGIENFVREAKKNGADGIIIPDLPLEEAQEILNITKKEDFPLIMLVAPTTSNIRLKKIISISDGFIYYVSLTGVTGTRTVLPTKIKENINKIKNITKIPLCVGFGISNEDQAKKISNLSDGIIVGSAIIKIIENNLNNKTLMIKKIEQFSKKIAKTVHKN